MKLEKCEIKIKPRIFHLFLLAVLLCAARVYVTDFAAYHHISLVLADMFNCCFLFVCGYMRSVDVNSTSYADKE